MARGDRPNIDDIKDRLKRWDSWTKEDIRQFVEHDLPDLVAYVERLEGIVAELHDKLHNG